MIPNIKEKTHTHLFCSCSPFCLNTCPPQLPPTVLKKKNTPPFTSCSPCFFHHFFHLKKKQKHHHFFTFKQKDFTVFFHLKKNKNNFPLPPIHSPPAIHSSTPRHCQDHRERSQTLRGLKSSPQHRHRATIGVRCLEERKKEASGEVKKWWRGFRVGELIVLLVCVCFSCFMFFFFVCVFFYCCFVFLFFVVFWGVCFCFVGVLLGCFWLGEKWYL